MRNATEIQKELSSMRMHRAKLRIEMSKTESTIQDLEASLEQAEMAEALLTPDNSRQPIFPRARSSGLAAVAEIIDRT